ncbi:MAG TPA: PaaX family transcriptional regulator C-terminal domain-containing protein [Marmoricola sp.]|nr:PaaX family transcriptional regulator C-terminal domain-containing protein [Marmoricola sp.]
MSAAAGPGDATGVRLRTLTARSAILSLLLGSHPPSATVSELVAFGRQLAIKESAVRAALTRMVAAADLHRDNGRYTLSDRLLERQRRQDEALEVPTGPWNGSWLVAAVVSNGRDRTSRLHLRRSMLAAHFGELREGVWMRPDNLAWHPDDAVAADLEILHARPTTPAADLVDRLFAPDTWASVGRDLLALAEASATPRDRLTAFATIVRHLTHDPLLPTQLLPADWPGPALRAAYAGFRDEVVDFRRTP